MRRQSASHIISASPTRKGMIDFAFKKKIKETLVITFRDTKNCIIFEWRRDTELAKVHNKWAVISLMLHKSTHSKKEYERQSKIVIFCVQVLTVSTGIHNKNTGFNHC